MKKVTNVKVVKKDVEGIIGSNVSKSQKMKDLFELGLEIKEIANMMGVRYNFVYNVVSNYVRMNDVEVEKVERDSKKNQIIELKEKGLTLVQISKELKVNYNYVHKVVKESKIEEESIAE